MKNAKKVLALVLCAVLLVGASVAGTLAYLTSKDQVVNTFTVGKVAIELHETGEKGRDDGTKGLDLHLVPNVAVAKDPTVTVLKDSEDCYVRVVVTVSVPNWNDVTAKNTGLIKDGENLATWAASFPANYLLNDATDGTAAGFNTANWTASNPTVDADTKTITYILTYKNDSNNVVAKNTAGNTNLPAIFNDVCAPAELSNDQLALLAGMTIKVEAHAIQADGFTDAADAWAKFDTQMGS